MEKKKHILLIMVALFAGGAEKQYRYIMRALAEKHAVSVLLLNEPIVGQEEHTKRFIQMNKDIQFYQLKGNALKRSTGGRAAVTLEKIRSLMIQWRWLRKYLKKNKIDAVMFTYVTQLLMVPLFIRNKVKTIYNERNTGRQVCDRKFKRNLLKKCSKVIANSDYAAHCIHDRTGIEVSVYKNGVEIKEIEKKAHSTYNILVPARINRIKNQKIVADAFALLKERLKQTKQKEVCVYFAGMCEDSAYLDGIRQTIETNALNIQILGFVEDMKELYEKTDLLILPSYEEGTPNVLLEAYMYRIDALVSNIPMNQACCLHKEMLFSPDDAKALAEKIMECIAEKKPVAYYEANRNYLIENYGMQQMKKRYLDLFANI